MHNYEFIFFDTKNDLRVILTVGGEMIRFILSFNRAYIIYNFGS